MALIQHSFAAFVDVSPEETLLKSPFENFEETTETSSSKDAQFSAGVSMLYGFVGCLWPWILE